MSSHNFNPSHPEIAPETVTNREFLAEVFRGIDTETETAWTTFYSVPPEKAGNSEWAGTPVNIDSVPDTEKHNAYFSTSTVSIHKGKRRKNSLQRAYCLVLDDSDGAIDIEPSWVLQTSPDSYQWGYIFDEPVRDINRYDQVLNRIKNMAGADKAGNNAVRYVRLPRAINNKLAYGGIPFLTKLIEWNPQRRYTLDQVRGAIEAKIPHKADSDGVVIPSEDRFAQKTSGTSHGDLITTIITAGNGLHDAIRSIAYRRVETGVNPGEIKQELQSYMNQVPQDRRDDRWLARYNAIDHQIRSAVEKIGQMHNEAIAPVIVAKPFDATSHIPRREFIEINGCKSYSRGFLTVTGAAGGTGKSSLSIVEELSVVLGVDLFHPDRKPLEGGPMAVWSMSLEDDENEHRRRVMAAMYHYAIKPEDLGGRYLVTYKADSPVTVVSSGPNNQLTVTPQVENIKDVIREHNIALLNCDPFVNSHQASENNNGDMNRVADAWRSIAQETNCAIGLTHHLRKGGGLSETNAEDLRGAVSLHAAARIVRILKNPSEDEATQTLGIDPGERKFYFWVDPTSKSNIAPPARNRVWYRMWGVDLMNGDGDLPGDNVGVATAFKLPDSLQGVTGFHVEELYRKMFNATDQFLTENCRTNVQAEGWIGYMIGEMVGLDPDDAVDKGKIKGIINEWKKSRVLKEDQITDKGRHKKPVFRLGEAANPVEIGL